MKFESGCQIPLSRDYREILKINPLQKKIPEFTFSDSKKDICLKQDKSILILIEKSNVNEDIFSRTLFIKQNLC